VEKKNSFFELAHSFWANGTRQTIFKNMKGCTDAEVGWIWILV
jgi:hypothetical protein